jgi:hypothetical protein
MAVAQLALTTGGSSLKVPTPPTEGEIATVTSLAALDTTGRVVSGIEKALDTTAQAINYAVPAAAHTVCSFLPVPEVVNSAVTSSLGFGTRVLTATAKESLQGAAFGATAWTRALRHSVAVNGATEDLEKASASKEFLARCIAESAEKPAVKESLLSYLALRSQLAELRAEESPDRGKISQLAQSLASFEVKLRDFQEFRDLKAALEAGTKFVEEHYKRINSLATAKADELIERVSHFYQEHVGSLAGEVEGGWARLETEEERSAARTKLRDQIAGRLLKVFESALSSEETKAALSKVTQDLHEGFDCYRSAFRGAVGTALGVLFVTGGLRGALQAAWDGASYITAGAASWVGDNVVSTVSSFTGWVGEQVTTRATELYEWAKDSIVHAATDNPLTRAGSAIVSAGIDAATAVSDGAQQLAESLMPASPPDLSHPYWTGSSRVMTGVDEHFNPLFGESCTSGFPFTPRGETLIGNPEGIAQYFTTPPTGPAHPVGGESATDFIMRRVTGK